MIWCWVSIFARMCMEVSKLGYNLFRGLTTYLYWGYNPVTKYHGHPSAVHIKKISYISWNPKKLRGQTKAFWGSSLLNHHLGTVNCNCTKHHFLPLGFQTLNVRRYDWTPKTYVDGRNPKQPPFGCVKPVVNNGILAKWCRYTVEHEPWKKGPWLFCGI